MTERPHTSIFLDDNLPEDDPSSCREPYLSIKDVTSVLGISRTTLLWYEKAGIVSPVRDERSGWRRYSEDDVLRLMGAMTLKNSGMAFSEQGIVPEDFAFTIDKIESYIDYSRRQSEYFAAQTECLTSIRNVIQISGTIMVGYLEPFYFYPHSMWSGQQSSFARDMPITALGCVTRSAWNEPIVLERGRTVPVRFAHLVETPAANPEVIAGCTCLFYPIALDDLFLDAGRREEILDEMDSSLHERGLEADGRLFIPRLIPFDKGGCAALCLPVRSEGHRNGISS